MTDEFNIEAVVYYDNIEELMGDLETLALYILTNHPVCFMVDAMGNPNKPYKLVMSRGDYEELCLRKAT